MTLQRGKFIVIEGTDGSGTTSQCKRVCSLLSQSSVNCVETREPSTGPVGALLRAAIEKRLDARPAGLDWQTLALLFAADRLDHAKSEIEPALAAGKWVISDRYTLSSLIYQSLTAPSPAEARPWVHTLNAHALRPDLVVILDVSPEVAEKRRRLRGGKEELFDRKELQQRLALAYLEAEKFSNENVVHIDGTTSIEAVSRQIVTVIAQAFSELKFTQSLLGALLSAAQSS